MAKLRYVGPYDEVEIAGVGNVARSAVINVPTDIAGRAPDARISVAMVELRDAITALDHAGAVALRAEIAGLDVGEGLLAQDTWELVKPGKNDEEVTS